MTVTRDPETTASRLRPGTGDAWPDRRRGVQWMIGLGVAVTVLGAAAATGTGIGLLLTSPSPIGLLAVDAPTAPPLPIPGEAGLAPGSAPVVVPVAGTLTSRPTALSVDPAFLPASCPAAAWQVRPAPAAPTAPLAAIVALAPTAPDTCQGFSGILPLLATLPPAPLLQPSDGSAPFTVSARTQTPVAVGLLATPGLTLERRGDSVVVVPIGAPSGPVPTSFLAEARIGDRWTTICPAVASGRECVDARAWSERHTDYRVTATLGAWRRSSAALRP